MPGIGIGVSKHLKKSSISWSTYWATRFADDLVLNILSDTENEIDWRNNGSQDYSYILIERAINGGVFTDINHATPGTSKYIDSGLTQGDTQAYRISYIKGINSSEYSNIVYSIPSVLNVANADNDITLADTSNEFWFSDGSNDKPFSICAIIKSNDLTSINTLVGRGNVTGESWQIKVNNKDGNIDVALYGSDLTGNNLLYAKANKPRSANVFERIIVTYDGSKAAAGINIYYNGDAVTYLVRQKYGTYNAMNNQSGVYIGKSIPDSYQGNFDLRSLVFCNKALSTTEVTEFQGLGYDYYITNLSFNANIFAAYKFDKDLIDIKGNHNGSAVTPSYKKEIYRLPSSIKTAQQTTYQNFKLGWFLCYGIETYNGDESNGVTVAVSNPNVFAAPLVVDVASWAAKAAESGKIDYAILTVSHIYGFSLYPHSSAIWGGSRNSIGGGEYLPEYTTYDVSQSGAVDQAIVTKFISEFNAVGIKPILYYCIGWGRNWLGRGYAKSNYQNSTYQWLYFLQYTKDRLTELAGLNPFAIWLDGSTYFPNEYFRELYSTIKSVNRDIAVITNIWATQSKTGNLFGPADGMSIEQLQWPALPSSVWGKTQSIKGIGYDCIMEASAPSRASSKWFYSSSPAALLDLATVQGYYDYAKSAGVPIAISMNPKLDGTLDEDQADLIASIVL